MDSHPGKEPINEEILQGVPVVAQRDRQHLWSPGTQAGDGLAQWVKNSVLLQLWLRSQLRFGSDLWPGNFHVPWGGQKIKEEIFQ